MIDLRYNYPVLPAHHELFRQALAALPPDEAYLLMEPPGHYAADRAVAAAWLARPGFSIDPDTVHLGCGGHHALVAILLAAQLAGRTVVVDAVAYNGFLLLARRFGVQLVACPLDADGMEPAALERLCRQHRAAAVYLTPTVHNPLGLVMPLARRRELVEVARRADVLLIDDDAYGFLQPEAPPSFAQLAPERSFYIFSLAKAVAPGAKLSYIVAPPQWREELINAIRTLTGGSVMLLTRLLGTWAQNGQLAQLIADKQREARRRQALAAAALRGLPYQAQPTSFHLWLPLPATADVPALERQLLARGVEVVTSAAYQLSSNPAHNGLRLALGNIADDALLTRGLSLVADTVLG
ncbi:PLP-dependent aminotransferase family protein [Hymenobacter jeollabukensis]|uniref:PLP-dependent aminotransferase family protein n=2 Tax=Hymenobacter jeollabukensis TaxID=2025313 RepID=A0A5R8WV90_9BACT|nr:PLP-dependent aminotransferase family protein [Hymenobacter jeollabukensis]